MIAQAPVLTPSQAAQELLKRRKARESLIDFTTYTYDRYVVEPLHRLIAFHLEECLARRCRRLMIFAPPQHGKSELVSVRFPAYWLAKHPNDPVILSSYASELAFSKSRQARDLIESVEYGNLFGNQSTRDGNPAPVDVRADQRAVSQWRLAPPYRGGMVAAGVGGPIVGHGAMLGIIDDPFESWAAAQSEAERKNVWEWYENTFYNRVWEQGVIVIIMTRWHEDDLAGRILAKQFAGGIAPEDHFTVVRAPALAETQDERDYLNERMGLPRGLKDPLLREAGEAVAPRRFSANYLKRVQMQNSYSFSALYQGAPLTPGGNRFKESFFKPLTALPMDKRARHVRYWDKAASETEDAAYTVGALVSAFPDGRFVISDVQRGQWDDLTRERMIRDTAYRDAGRFGKYNVRIYLEQEPGSGGKDSLNATIRMLAGFNVYGDRVGSRGSKEVRWEPYAAQAGAGNVYLVNGVWNRAFIDEHLAAPNGKWLDQVDAAAGGFTFAADWIRSSITYSTTYA